MKILLTGDSIFSRYESLNQPAINFFLLQHFPDAKIINTAYPGLNSGGLCASIEKRIISQEKCDILIILIGTNDLATHKQVPLKQFKRNLQYLVSSIVWLYYPPKILLVSPPAVDETKQRVRSNKLVQKYAKVIEKVAKEYRITYVNLFKKMRKQKNLEQLCHGNKNDGLHFGLHGYQLLSDLLKQHIEKIL